MGKTKRAKGTRKPVVLVVEDAEDSRDMYLEYLEFAGFRAVGASNGVEAVAMAHEHTPSVVVMDLSLPTMDGWEATALLKRSAATRSIRIIALTGHGEAPYRQRAFDAGVDLFVMKPCMPADLADHVRDVMTKKRLPRPSATHLRAVSARGARRTRKSR